MPGGGLGFVHPWLVRLQKLLEQLQPPWAELHRNYLLGTFVPSGGWSGRQGPPNPYYTSFGLRSLFLLGGIPHELSVTARRLLSGLDVDKLPPADFFALVAVKPILGELLVPPQKIADVLTRLVSPDGGFAALSDVSEGSVYATFLAVETLSLTGDISGDSLALGAGRLVSREQLCGFLLSRQRVDGGFAEAAAAPFGAVPATVGALATFRLLGFCPSASVEAACRFLASMQDITGGFRAAALAPVPDLLSTALALLALADWANLDYAQVQVAQGFLDRCECANGGFRADPHEREPDVEYTFYGVLSRAICLGKEKASL